MVEAKMRSVVVRIARRGLHKMLMNAPRTGVRRGGSGRGS